MRSRITSRAESWSAKALGRTWIACATPPSRWLQSLPEAKSDRSSGSLPALPAHEDLSAVARSAKAGGAEGNRTPDLCSAIAALSHLSYSPAPCLEPSDGADGGPRGAQIAARPCQRNAGMAPRSSIRVAVVDRFHDLDGAEQDLDEVEAATAAVVRPGRHARRTIGSRQGHRCAWWLARKQGDPLPRLTLVGEGDPVGIAPLAPAADDDVLGTDAPRTTQFAHRLEGAAVLGHRLIGGRRLGRPGRALPCDQ